MAETTITNLPDGQTPGVSATRPLSGTERVPMDQGATTVDATTQDIADLADAAITSAVDAHEAAPDPHPGYLLESDASVTNARTPTAHASTHATAGSDPLTPAAIGAATAAQGSLADSAVQPGDLATVATTGAYANLSGTPSLGNAAGLNVGTTAGTVAAGDDARLSDARTPTAHAGTHATGQPDELTPAAIGAATAAQGSLADSAVQPGALAAVATTGAYADLSGTPSLGTAAALDVGTGANQVVQLNGSSQLPAVDGSLLTNLPGGGYDGTTALDISVNGAASTPPLELTGTWFTGGTTTTTKPALLIEPTGTTSTAWSTNGTGLGVNAPSGFTGNYLSVRLNNTSLLDVQSLSTHTCILSAPTSIYMSAGSGYAGLYGPSVRLLGAPPTSGFILTTSKLELARDASFLIQHVDSSNGSALNGASLTLAGQNRTSASATLANGGNVVVYGGDAPSANANPFNGGSIYLDGGQGNTGGASGNVYLCNTRGQIFMPNLPTSNPSVAGQLWNDGTTLKVSAG